MRQITWSEVAKHNGDDGTYWIVIHNKVADVTKFLVEHPGGEEVLESLAGKDATACWEDIGHSDDAARLKEKYIIGEISEHPGGEEVLLEQSGKDATESFEDVGHSSDAREMMAKYKIGELVEEERTNKEKKNTWSNSDVPENNNDSAWKSWVVPIVVGLVATMIYRFFLLRQ